MGTTLFNRRKRDAERSSYRIGNAASVAVGEYICLNTVGDAVTVADTAGFVPLGFAVGFSDKATANGTDLGDTAATPPPEVEVDIGGGIVEGLTVVGVAGTNADKGLKVYVTAANTFTLAETTNLPALGEIVRSVSATDVDVYFYPAGAIGAVDGRIQRRSVLVGLIGGAALASSVQRVLTRWVARENGEISRIYAQPTAFDAGYTAGSLQLVVFIGSTQVTNSANLTLRGTGVNASADMGTILAAGAVTANNVFSAGQTLAFRRNTGGTAFAAGASGSVVHFALYLDYDRVPRWGNRTA